MENCTVIKYMTKFYPHDPQAVNSDVTLKAMWAWCLLFWLFLVTGALSQYTFQDAAFGLSNLRVLSDQDLLMKGVENIVSFAIQNEEHMASV